MPLAHSVQGILFLYNEFMSSKFFSHTLHEYKLSSGAKLLYVSAPLFPLSVTSVWVRAGSRFDPVGQEGLSHFFEHLLMSKTKRFPEKILKVRALESKGIDYNAFTNYETACYYHIQDQSRLSESLELLLDGLNNSIFNETDVEREKNVILDESLRNFNDPAQYIWQLSSRGLWPDSALARNFFGDKTSLDRVKLGDIVAFQKKFYTPQNTTFVVVGSDDSGETIKEFIDKYFHAEVKSFAHKEMVQWNLPKKFVFEEREGLTQVTVGINYQLPFMQDLKQEVVADYLRSYFASGWSSRLIEKMRIETGVTYWVNGVLENFADTGYLRFEFSTDTNSLEKSLEKALAEIEALKQGVDLQTFETTKKSLELSLKRYYLDPKNLMWFYGWNFSLEKTPHTLKQYQDALAAIETQDLVEAAQDIFQESKRSIAFIGSKKEILPKVSKHGLF